MIKDAGVDTWSVCWYLAEGSQAHKAIDALATLPAKRSKLIDGDVAGHKVGWFPGSRLLFAEGHPSTQGLCKSHDLPAALDAVVEGLADIGVLPPRFRRLPEAGLAGPNRVLGGVGFGGVRRLDSTVDLEFSKPAEGLAVLSGVAALPLPRIKTVVTREVGGRRVETVELKGTAGRATLGRWYDKGLESGLAARGCLLRPEDQRRFAKAARPPVDVLGESGYVRDSFVKRFEPLWQASKGVKVAMFEGLVGRVRELVDEGEMTPGEAKAALGHLVLDTGGERMQSRRTWYRDRAVARKHGLVLAEGAEEEVEIDLREVMEAALDSEAWGAQG